MYLLFGACTGVLYFGERGEVDTDSAIVFLSSGRRVEVESVFEAVLMCVSILRFCADRTPFLVNVIGTVCGHVYE